MTDSEKLIYQIKGIQNKFNNSLEELEQKAENIEEATKSFIAHIDLLEQERKRFNEEKSLKFNAEFSKAFADQKASMENLFKSLIKDTLYELKSEAQSTIESMKSIKTEDRLNRYLIMAAFSIGVLATSMGIQWYFPHKHDHHYHLSKDMAAEMRMGRYANMALDDMEEKERQKFLKHIEKAAKKVLERR